MSYMLGFSSAFPRTQIFQSPDLRNSVQDPITLRAPELRELCTHLLFQATNDVVAVVQGSIPGTL